MNSRELREHIGRLPRIRLAHLPTPLEELPRFSEAVGVRVLIKRDDCTGLAFGGSKTRQLEFTVGDAIANGCDTLIQGGAAQSNHCRQVAAVAAKYGLECHLIVTCDAHSEPVQGGLLLDYLLGAHIHWFEGTLGKGLEQAKQELAKQLEAQGKKPYGLIRPRSTAVGTVAHCEAVCELHEQLDESGIKMDWLYLSSAGTTQAGYVLGVKALGSPIKVVGIAALEWQGGNRIQIVEAANVAATLLGINIDVSDDDVCNDVGYIGDGYGVVTAAGRSAIGLLARTEGIIADPVYTGKALAGLIDHVRQGRIAKNETVVFLHTGGTPALFAYSEDLLEVKE